MEGRIWLIIITVRGFVYPYLPPSKSKAPRVLGKHTKKRFFGFLFLSTSAKDLSDSKITLKLVIYRTRSRLKGLSQNLSKFKLR